MLSLLWPLEEAATAESWVYPKPPKLIEIDLVEIQTANAGVIEWFFPGKLLFASLKK